MRPFTLVQTEIREGIQAHQAQPEDSEAVMALLLKTAQWFKSRGSSQWNALLEGVDSHNTKEVIKEGNVFIFKDGDQIAAMVILLTEASPWDIELWGAEGHEESFYVHRLAVDRDYAGRGLGQAVLEWVEHGIAIEGKPQIRLDCIGTNDTLYRFYSNAGYTHKGLMKGFHLFEKPSAVFSR